MKNRVTILSLLFALFSINYVNAQCPNTTIYWEQMSDSVKKETISSVDMDTNVVNYYNKHSKFSDNEQSFRLLDTLISRPNNANVKALYFDIFNDICISSDGAVSDVLGNYCQKVLINDPIYVLNYLSSDNPLLKKYAQLLGYEFYLKEQGVSDLEYNICDFKKIINREIKCFNTTIKKTLDDLIKEIEITMKDME